MSRYKNQQQIVVVRDRRTGETRNMLVKSVKGAN